jgi:hypothetical protein
VDRLPTAGQYIPKAPCSEADEGKRQEHEYPEVHVRHARPVEVAEKPSQRQEGTRQKHDQKGETDDEPGEGAREAACPEDDRPPGEHQEDRDHGQLLGAGGIASCGQCGSKRTDDGSVKTERQASRRRSAPSEVLTRPRLFPSDGPRVLAYPLNRMLIPLLSSRAIAPPRRPRMCVRRTIVIT